MKRYLIAPLAALAILISACWGDDSSWRAPPSDTDAGYSGSGEPYDGYYEEMRAESLEREAWREYIEECNFYQEEYLDNGGFAEEARDCEAVIEERFQQEYDRARYDEAREQEYLDDEYYFEE